MFGLIDANGFLDTRISTGKLSLSEQTGVVLPCHFNELFQSLRHFGNAFGKNARYIVGNSHKNGGRSQPIRIFVTVDNAVTAEGLYEFFKLHD